MRFFHREQIIDFLRRTRLRRCVRRSLESGTIEHLGAFRRIPPGRRGGYIVKVTSPNGIIYLVAVTPADDLAMRWNACLIEAVPWDQWAGDVRRYPRTLYEGDHPDEYAKKIPSPSQHPDRGQRVPAPEGGPRMGQGAPGRGGQPVDDLQLDEGRP